MPLGALFFINNKIFIIMSVIEVKDLEQFNKLILKNPKVVVDFMAVWCGPCKGIRPVFHELAEKHKKVVFLEVDVDAAGPVAQEYKIMSMPTFKFFLNGKEQEDKAIRGDDKKILTGTVEKLADEGEEEETEE